MHVWALLWMACASRPDVEGTPPAVADLPSVQEEGSLGACPISVGTHPVTIEVAGQRRTALVRRGADAGDAAPVLFVWHGFGASARSILPAVSAEKHWDDALVVAPQGLDRTFEKFGLVARPGWQVSLGELRDRDLQFFDALLDHIRPCMDSGRVYSTGFSNGGFFSNVLGCHRLDTLAAIAPVGGGGPFASCQGAMPVMVTHGTADRTVAYEMAVNTVQAWSEPNQCVGPVPRSDGCTSLNCETPVALCVFDGGHTWPRGTDAAIAAFLRSHVRESAE